VVSLGGGGFTCPREGVYHGLKLTGGSRVPHAGRSSPEGANGREDWLAADEWSRLRPWAYEEILFGSPEERARSRELVAVVGELEAERVELAALHEELDLHLTRIAELERRLEGLKGNGSVRETAETDETPAPLPPARARPTLPHPRSGSLDDDGGGDGVSVRWAGATPDRRSRLLARCDGFDVEAPEGPVGFVEGLRFGSRIDCPDLLEVRGGRFGRQLLLVPIEEVDEIRLADRCVVLRSAPVLATDLLDDLGERLRRVLHFDHTAT
jgi:hypothetical protein